MLRAFTRVGALLSQQHFPKIQKCSFTSMARATVWDNALLFNLSFTLKMLHRWFINIMPAQKITKIVKSYLCNQCQMVKKPEWEDVNSPLRTVGANSHDNDVMIPSGNRNRTFLLGKSSEKISTPPVFQQLFLTTRPICSSSAIWRAVLETAEQK